MRDEGAVAGCGCVCVCICTPVCMRAVYVLSDINVGVLLKHLVNAHTYECIPEGPATELAGPSPK